MGNEIKNTLGIKFKTNFLPYVDYLFQVAFILKLNHSTRNQISNI